jgi:ubiquinone/menaquinone biosynthesis C-methylase UbiE
MPVDTSNAESLKATVRERYGKAALQVVEGNETSCCGGGDCFDLTDPITRDLYNDAQASDVPAAALLASFGCGNPTALAELKAGEVVLDLGSGGGIDVLLSAKRVGPTGKAYGLDMTDEMLTLARQNQQAAGVTNVEFLKGDIEHIPLPDASVDVIISNCVINLAADKGKVLAEAFRVLKPGGRFAVSDIITRGELHPMAKRSLALWTGCIAGSLEEQEFIALLEQSGFTDASIEPTRVYTKEDAATFLEGANINSAAVMEALDGKILSAFVRARKPA